MFEFAPTIPLDQPGHEWTQGSNHTRTDLQVGLCAASLAKYMNNVGHQAQAHFGDDSSVDLVQLAVKSGLVAIKNHNLVAPFLHNQFRIGAVTCYLGLECDRPLDSNQQFPTLSEQRNRPMWMGPYPMETIPRQPDTTNLINRDQIQRVSAKSNMYYRAANGDFGKREHTNIQPYLRSTPLTCAVRDVGDRIFFIPTVKKSCQSLEEHDPVSLSQNIKALCYWLGADAVGICATEPMMFYSHDLAGKPLDSYRKRAIVMLFDMGYDVSEASSGDDWIVSSQVVETYQRINTVGKIVETHINRLGFSTKSHGMADTEVLQMPAVLMAGLAEVSRIGEVAINPFLGPRFKSLVVTTDMMLDCDQPINFGLQDFCESCRKCAQECPPAAIPFGPKVMYNGYEIWKPDAELCLKYRTSLTKGSSCGRCIKVCPWSRSNTDLTPGPDQDSQLSQNLDKKWWLGMTMFNGVPQSTPGENVRPEPVAHSDKLAERQRIAVYTPDLMPQHDTLGPVVADRQQALDASLKLVKVKKS